MEGSLGLSGWCLLILIDVEMQEAVDLSSAVLGQTLLHKDAQMLDITQQRTQHSHVGRKADTTAMGGPVNGRKTPRSQFPRACFFETSTEPSAAIRLRALPELDQTVWFRAVHSCFWL